jgi:hypothetical protein
MIRVSIFLITVALIAGMVGCGEPAYNLTVASTTGGNVTTPGEGTFAYDAGTVVSLNATPDTGYWFVNWTGNVSTIANVNAAATNITMNGDYSITANFEEIVEYDLVISSTTGGSVTTPGEGTFTYYEGRVVGLVAEAGEGYYFVNWTGDVGTIANVNVGVTTITMNGNYSITANFEQIPPGQFGLTISSTVGGSVTVPGEGTFAYDAGTVVSLVASPASGYQFVNWTGDVATISCQCHSTSITMNGNYSITANFEEIPPVQYDLTISSTAGGSVTTPGEGTFPYAAGTVVDLVAEAEEGYGFVNWTGDVGTIANVCAASTNITMNGKYSITANFGSVYGDYSDILNHIVTSQSEIDISQKVTLVYPEGCGPVAYYAGAWPSPQELEDFYWENVKDVTPYSSDTIDLAGVNMNLGPLYRNGTLEILNSGNTPATLTLTGTIYITGDTVIGTVGKDMTLDLNGNTIFVSSSTTGNQRALAIGSKCTIEGPGIIIAIGDMYFAPKSQLGGTTNPIFMLSVLGQSLLQPGGDIYGAIASSVGVAIQPGIIPTITYPAGGFGGLNFPGLN